MFGIKRKTKATNSLIVDKKDTPLSLQHLEAIFVLVEDDSPNTNKNGFNLDVIQNDVESKCKRVGLKVFSNEESFDLPGYPILAVTINTKPIKSNEHFLFSIHVGLHQNVHLERNPGILIIGATTWTSMSYGIGKNFDLIRAKTNGHMDRFTRDYLAASSRSA